MDACVHVGSSVIACVDVARNAPAFVAVIVTLSVEALG